MSKSQSQGSKGQQQRQALIAAATAGDPDAQSRTGDHCRTGDEFNEQDLSKAVRWYTLASEQGEAAAQNNLASMYWGGIGVAKDPVAAVMWYRRAAEQGNAVARYNLAMALFNGIGVAEDPTEGAKLMKQAAEGGYPLAQTEWGTRLRFGRGVPQDIVAAAEPFILAARRGNIPAMGNLCDMEAELREAAMGGNPAAAQCLKTMHRLGLGVLKSRKLSNRWGNLWADLENARSEPYMAQVLDKDGELYLRLWDEYISAAPRDGLYTLEWLYRSGTAPEVVSNGFDPEYCAKYKARRDAGMPAPWEAGWSEDDWRKWKVPPAPQAVAEGR